MRYRKEIMPDRTHQVPDLREYSIYQQEIEKLKKLCSSIQKEKSKEVSQALKNYVIIRLIGVSENLLKSMTAHLIDGKLIAKQVRHSRRVRLE